MSVAHHTRPSSADEIAAEMDRRGAVIEQLEADLAAQIAGHRESARQSTQNLLRATSLLIAGKHLAVKLAEVYRAAGSKPAECQAIRDWMAAVAQAEGRV